MLSINRTLCILVTGAYIKKWRFGEAIWVVSVFAFFLRFASILLWYYLRGRQNVPVRRRGVKAGAMAGRGRALRGGCNENCVFYLHIARVLHITPCFLGRCGAA